MRILDKTFGLDESEYNAIIERFRLDESKNSENTARIDQIQSEYDDIIAEIDTLLLEEDEVKQQEISQVTMAPIYGPIRYQINYNQSFFIKSKNPEPSSYWKDIKNVENEKEYNDILKTIDNDLHQDEADISFQRK
jgi:hypothetical protein